MSTKTDKLLAGFPAIPWLCLLLWNDVNMRQYALITASSLSFTRKSVREWDIWVFEQQSHEKRVERVVSYWGSQKTMLAAAARIFTYPSHSFTDIRAKGRLGSQSCSTKSDHGSFCYNLLVRNNKNEFTAKIDELETTTRGLNDKRKNSKTGLASVPMETPSINGCESIQKIEM